MLTRLQDHDSEALARLLREAAELVQVGSACTRSDELALAVKALENRRATVEQMLRELIKPVETYPQGQQNLPRSTTTSRPQAPRAAPLIPEPEELCRRRRGGERIARGAASAVNPRSPCSALQSCAWLRAASRSANGPRV
jgi:hypothetical protein